MFPKCEKTIKKTSDFIDKIVICFLYLPITYVYNLKVEFNYSTISTTRLFSLLSVLYAGSILHSVCYAHAHITAHQLRVPWSVKTAAVTASYTAVLGPYFAGKRSFYVITGHRTKHRVFTYLRRNNAVYHRIPECAARITGRVKTARIVPFTYRILIVYGRLWIVSFDLGD